MTGDRFSLPSGGKADHPVLNIGDVYFHINAAFIGHFDRKLVDHLIRVANARFDVGRSIETAFVCEWIEEHLLKSVKPAVAPPKGSWKLPCAKPDCDAWSKRGRSRCGAHDPETKKASKLAQLSRSTKRERRADLARRVRELLELAVYWDGPGSEGRCV